jgi:hypothetical protein
MTSAPPEYTPSDAPPSYEDVIKRLNELIGDNPTATEALEAAQNLSDADVEVLVREHENHYPLTTEEEKKAFAVNMCRSSSSTEGAIHLKEASKAASEVAKEIALAISSLDRKLAAIDLAHGSNFRPKILGIQKVNLISLSFFLCVFSFISLCFIYFVLDYSEYILELQRDLG